MGAGGDSHRLPIQKSGGTLPQGRTLRGSVDWGMTRPLGASYAPLRPCATGPGSLVLRALPLNLKKREGNREEFPEEWENFYPVHSDEPQRRYENLVEIIRRMPERYRQILELKFVLEWSNKEIAAFLNMKESSVASRIARGRSMLRAKLEEEERDGVES